MIALATAGTNQPGTSGRMERSTLMAAGDTQITITRIGIYEATSLSARLTRNADGASYRPNYEARRQSRREIREPHYHSGSAEGRSQRRSYRAVLCRCGCGNELTPALRSLISGDARSCGCSRGRPKYEWRCCPVCGRLARIRRDRRSCSRACGHKLTGAALRAESPSYDVWHNRVKTARGPASEYRCADCGGQPRTGPPPTLPAMTSGSDSSHGAAHATAATTAPSARGVPAPS